MVKKRTAQLLVVACVLIESYAAQASLSFSFNYTDSAGTGFKDATLGATRQASLESAAGILAGYFNVAAPVTVNIDVNTGGSGSTLASGGSPILLANGFQPTVVQYKILNNGADENGSSADGTMQVNFSQSWFYGDTATGGSYDFKNVAMHELMHAMGFLSEITSSGTGAAGHASGTPDSWTPFDQFLTDSAGNRLVNNSTFAFNTGKSGVLTGGPGSGGIFFSGPNAISVFGDRVPIYSPNPWVTGSSGSHIDGGLGGFISDIFLMDPSVTTGLGIRALTPVEQAFMRDIGYSVVPEPALTGLLAAVGLVACAAANRWRKA